MKQLVFSTRISQIVRCLLLSMAVVWLSLMFASVSPTLAACDPDASVIRASVASDGTQGNTGSSISYTSKPTISADGNYVVFDSTATTLVSDDNNGKMDIFLYERITCQTSRISLATDGSSPNGDSTKPDISPNGRWIVFTSEASNLVVNDTNNAADIFLFDRQTGETSRVSVANDGSQANNFSFALWGQLISADGRYVVFTSYASNLVANDTNNVEDVFVRDRQLNQTFRVSIASDGSQTLTGSNNVGQGISEDGRYVLFRSGANNLTTGDTNNTYDTFLRDLQTQQTTRISLTSNGTQANGGSEGARISSDNQFIIFDSFANNIVGSDTNNINDTFLRNQSAGTVNRVDVSSAGTEGNGTYNAGDAISANNRYITFSANSSNLVDNDTNATSDIFVYDRLTGQTKRISLDENSQQANGLSAGSDISADGTFVTFYSNANNLVAGDTNGVTDVFIVRLSTTSNFIVTSADDVNDGVCSLSHCSLREAINAANANSDVNTIAFSVAGSGVHTIQPSTPLPIISNPVIIDGTTQPGYAVGAPVIELNGVNAVTTYPDPLPPIDLVGINIVGASDSAVRGLILNGWGYGGVGILNGSNNIIQGNFIGTNAAGTSAVPNLYGVIIYNGSNNRVGGTTPDQRNLISGNNDDGVNIGGQTSAQAVDNLVQGNYIGTNWAGTAALGNHDDGVKVEIADGTIIGGTNAGARNVIAASTHHGIILKGAGTINSLVQGNYIGTNASGTAALGNGQAGVQIEDSANNSLVGGTVAGAGNVISGNQYGVFVASTSATNTIQGNFIGTDASGTIALAPQSAGVALSGNNNTLGGTTPAARNIISGNVVGIGILGMGNVVQGNYIGTDITGVQDVGNTAWGIEMVGSPANNSVGGTAVGAGNTIAYNGSNGIALYGPTAGTGNAILGNSIFSNAGLGINLSANVVPDGVTPNDSGDLDTGPNNLQNFPVITTVTPAVSSITIAGTLNSETNKTYHLEFFASSMCDSPFYREGQTYLGFVNATTNGSGNATFSTMLSVSVPQGKFITATATDPSSNTSEFSACVTVPEFAQAGPTFTVNTTADTNDGVCGIGHCTLREAIGAANANSNTNTIAFAISGGGVHTIQPTSELPLITYPVIIDGTTQTGYAGTPLIEIDGTNAGTSARGLTLTGGNSTVKGLIVNRFALSGIWLFGGGNNVVVGNYLGTDSTGTQARGNRDGITIGSSANNRIGGLIAAERNILSGNTDDGINLADAATTGTLIEGNYIGVDVSGQVALGNTESGIDLSQISIATIGGTTAAARNIISGNQYGIFFQDPSDSVLVEGNYIGTNVLGTATIPNQIGIWTLNGDDSQIGGVKPAARNIISGNVTGIKLGGFRNTIQGNYIGVAPDGTTPLGNTGAGIDVMTSFFGTSPNHMIGGTTAGTGNIIARNGTFGVTSDNPGISARKPFAVLGNSIFANGNLGIDLGGDGVSVNDAGDADTGPNGFQNFPVLSSGGNIAAGTSISGTLNSKPNTTYRLEFFANASCDASGNGEGQTYLGFASVTTNGSGDAAFTANVTAIVSAGQFITATATAPDNSTSEFSACIIAVNISAPAVAPITNYYRTNAVTLTWTGVTWATGYKIEVDDNADFMTPAFTSPQEATVRSVIAILPLVDKDYYWRVGAKQADGTIRWSTSQKFRVDVP